MDDYMRITLISADDELWASGMRSISSVLRRAGHQTTMIFAGSTQTPLSPTAMGKILDLAATSDIIGISSMSRGSTRAKELIGNLRPQKKLIVWGGVHPTLFPEDCTKYADIVCRGEGEEFMLDLVDRVASGRGYGDILNGAYMTEGCTVLNEIRPPIPDLDSLPFPDYAFENEYILDRTGALVPNITMREGNGIKGIILFSGSRGCNNTCTYCSNSQLISIYRGNGRYVRKMSIARFNEGASECRRLFPHASRFYFTDEDFFARPVEELREFSDTYPDSVGLPFQCMASPRQITDEKMELMVKAGLTIIQVGLESGSERVRQEIFHRHITDEMQMRATKAINQHPQVNVVYFLIIGNPYEERTDLVRGMCFMENMPFPFHLQTYNLVFLPGTKLYNQACKDGIINGIDDSATNIDFLRGFDHRTHDWKRNNLYLNSILSLMTGRSTKWRIGLIPRSMIPVLKAPRVVAYCDRHTIIGETIAMLGSISSYPRRHRSDW
jgi:anaerobic magnesium-protoporphyrin IX monomethyl ester cyclase